MRRLLVVTLVLAIVLPLSAMAGNYAGVSGEGVRGQSDSSNTSITPGDSVSPQPNPQNQTGTENDKPVSTIPEPTTLLLIGAGLVGVVAVRRWRRS